MLKKITNLVVLILCCTFSNQAIAQDQTQSQVKENSLIIYKHFLWGNSPKFPRPFNYEPKAFDSYGWSVAYRKTKYSDDKIKTHQFEFQPFFKNSDDAYQQLDLKFRYERGKYLKRKLFKVIDVNLGGAISANYLSENIFVSDAFDFPTEIWHLGLGLSFFTHLEYKISDAFTIHLNASFIGTTFSLNQFYSDNPALTESQKTQGGFDFDLGGDRVLRLGLGYNF